MDPLSALRDFTIRNDLDSIHRDGDDFRFGSDYCFPCTLPTAYRSKQGNLYTLETLVHFVKNHHLKHTDYMHNARTIHNLPSVVTFIDRKPLLDYLQGKVSSSDSIQFLAPQPQSQLQNPKFDEYRPEDPALVPIAANDAAFDPNLDSRVRVFDNYMAMVKAVERPLKDRDTMLECRNRDFYGVLTAASRRDGLAAAAKNNRVMRGDERGLGLGFGGGEELGFDSTPRPRMVMKGSKIGEGVPIILVPSASQTLITIHNVKEFLEDGVFVPTEVKVRQVKGAKPDCVTVQKKFSRDRVVMAYEVRDKPSGLKNEDWERVVAVFVLGKEWQFKDWPFKDHVEIFNKILGFYMRFEDDSVESAKNVKQWNVKIISISKNKRHQDRAAALEVWDRLEEFMRSRSRG